MKRLTQARRAYIYRVLFAAGAVAVGYGLIDGEQLALWLGLAGTTLGNGLAAANTSTHP